MDFDASQGDRKYRTSARVGGLVDCSGIQVELRRFDPGWQVDLTLECTEIAVLLSGQSKIRWTGDGRGREAVARPGVAWVCPAGVNESDVEIVGTMPESLHIFLPPSLVGESALSNYGIDPARVQLAYAGGVPDPMVLQIGQLFRGLLNRKLEATDRMFLDGIQLALAAHLLGTYSSARWRPPTRTPTIDPTRLRRVLDFIEARIAAEISLDDLAAEACMSPFHFSRMFRAATGLAPHRYVTERRIEAAKEKLRLARSALVEIALDTGFGSQANFTRVFRKKTGLTPGQYRALAKGLKRVAIFQIRSPRFRSLFLRMSLSKPLHTFAQHALGLSAYLKRLPASWRAHSSARSANSAARDGNTITRLPADTCLIERGVLVPGPKREAGR